MSPPVWLIMVSQSMTYANDLIFEFLNSNLRDFPTIQEVIALERDFLTVVLGVSSGYLFM